MHEGVYVFMFMDVYELICVYDVYACVGMHIYNMYVCVYSYICMYVGVHVCVCTCGMHVWVHV